MTSNSRMITIATAALALAALTTGCGKSTASTSPDTATATDGGAKLPAGFPKDVPIPSGAKVTNASDVSYGANVGYQVAFDSSDTTANIVAAITKSLTDGGWSVNQTTAVSAQLTSMGATKPAERRELNVQIVDADGKRSVTETVMSPKS